MQRKLDVRTQAEKIKEKMRLKKLGNPTSRSNSESMVVTSSQEPLSDVRNETDDDLPAKNTIDSNAKFREPQMELFDLQLSHQDFKDLGSGLPALSKEDANDMMVRQYLKQQENLRAKKKKQMEIEKAKKLPSQREKPKEADSEEVSEATHSRRQEYDNIAGKLKDAFKRKDKAWLSQLVNDDASLCSKRMLLSKLMEENHSMISKELAAIRFSGEIMQNDTIDKTISAEQIAMIKEENETFDDLPHIVDFHSLPDELFVQIESFIKQEIPGLCSEYFNIPCAIIRYFISITDVDAIDDPDEITEVPVPPKPAPLCVDLEEKEPEKLSNPENEEIVKQDPLVILRTLNDEESTLIDQLSVLDEQRQQIMQRLNNLHELRSQILLSTE